MSDFEFWSDDSAAKRTRKSDKQLGLYIIIALIACGLGIHNFYAGRMFVGLMQLAIFVCSILFGFLTFGFGFVLLAIPVFWTLLDIILVRKDGQGLRMA